MSLSRLIPALVVLLATSLAIMLWGASQGIHALSATGAVLAAGSLTAAGYLVNSPFWRLEPSRVSPVAAPIAGRRNARLMALGYGWGGATLLAVYTVSGLRWQHGWQYASAMALIAGVLFAYAVAIGDEQSRLRAPRWQLTALRLTILQGALALGGVGWLMLSGKIHSAKADWAANHVFVAGGLAIAVLSAVAGYTHHRLQRAGHRLR